MRIRFPVVVCRALYCTVIGGALLLFITLWISPDASSYQSKYARINNIVFLKTHKTGSCTLQNILFRYGHERDLIFALPAKTFFAGYPKHFLPEHVVPLVDPSMGYNIFCFHARFNYSSFQAIMPSDTKYITVLRNPVPMFESLYNYFHMKNGFHLTLEEIMQMPEDSPIFQFRWSGMLGINQMSFDLGLKYEDFRSPKKLLDAVLELEKQFHLVMINELMDESLILLRHLMGWDVDDIVSFSHNVRVQSEPADLSEELKKNMSVLNGADEFLYYHFRLKLEQTIYEFGYSRMQREIEVLQIKRQIYRDRCVGSIGTINNITETQFKPIMDNVIGFNLKVDDEVCVHLARAEWPYINGIHKVYLEKGIVTY